MIKKDEELVNEKSVKKLETTRKADENDKQNNRKSSRGNERNTRFTDENSNNTHTESQEFQHHNNP